MPEAEGDGPQSDPVIDPVWLLRNGFGKPTPLLCVGQLTSGKEIQQLFSLSFPKALSAV